MGPEQQCFVIRHNPDNSYDSICLRCFRTVGTSSKQSELAAFERNHVCEIDSVNETVLPFARKPDHIPPSRKADSSAPSSAAASPWPLPRKDERTD
jgi:hypothetical protein